MVLNSGFTGYFDTEPKPVIQYQESGDQFPENRCQMKK